MTEIYATGVQHIGVPTQNVGETVQFYEGLGFTVDWRGKDAQNDVAFLKLGNLVIETYYMEETAGKAGAVDHIAIDVTDIEKTYANIKAGGYHILDQEIQYLPFYEKGVRFFTITGPSGEKVEFNQKLN